MTPANDNELPFLSVCAGIEAASVAWHPLGYRAVMLSEIDRFPRLVLAHRWNARPAQQAQRPGNVALWGDFTAIRPRHFRRMGIPLPQVIIGGTPCQAFSLAGARKSLADARGNLTLSFVRLVHAFAAAGSLRNAVWENVPGVLSTSDNAFGCFLAGLVGADAPIPSPAGRSWPDAGMVAGPKGRAAWRVLDAQFFGLAQRRRRVFVVADFGNGADPAEVLFERAGLHGNSPPRREAWEGAAGYAASSIGSYREAQVSGPVRAAGGDSGGGSETLVSYAPEIARCVATREGSSQDYESTTMVAVSVTGAIAHTLKADGADASEDGTGRGTPIVTAHAFDARQSDVIQYGDMTGPLDTDGHTVGVLCFSSKDRGQDVETEMSTTLRAGGHSSSHANAGVPPAIVANMPVHPALCAAPGGPASQDWQMHSAVTHGTAVRRLTPRECERLQGFPDDYTRINDNTPDGPRYKALGNSMAVPVISWIGRRLRAGLERRNAA